MSDRNRAQPEPPPTSFTVTVTSLVTRVKFYSMTEYQAKWGAFVIADGHDFREELAGRGHDLILEAGQPEMIAVTRIYRETRM